MVRYENDVSKSASMEFHAGKITIPAISDYHYILGSKSHTRFAGNWEGNRMGYSEMYTSGTAEFGILSHCIVS